MKFKMKSGTLTQDSGATVHMTNQEICQTENRRTIDIDMKSDGKIVKSSLQGTAKLYLVVNGHSKTVRAENVLYSPEFHGNVLSVPRMTSIGHKVVFTYERCYIYKENRELLATGTRRGNLDVLDITEEKVFQVETRDKNEEHPRRDRDHRQSDKERVKRTEEKSRDVPVKNKKNTALSGSYKIKRNEHERNAEQRQENVGGKVKEKNDTRKDPQRKTRVYYNRVKRKFGDDY